MRRAVGAHQTASVDCEDDGQVLERHVMNDLVDRTLQESRVDRHDGLDALAGKACSIGDRMLLGDGDVAIALGIAARELDESRALAHGGRYAVEALVGGGRVAEPAPEDFGVGRSARLLFGKAEKRIKDAHAVVGRRIHFSRLVALALLGRDVQHARAVEPAQVLEHLDESDDVVAVDGTVVVEVEAREDARGRTHEVDRLLLHTLGDVP